MRCLDLENLSHVRSIVCTSSKFLKIKISVPFSCFPPIPSLVVRDWGMGNGAAKGFKCDEMQIIWFGRWRWKADLFVSRGWYWLFSGRSILARSWLIQNRAAQEILSDNEIEICYPGYVFPDSKVHISSPLWLLLGGAEQLRQDLLVLRDVLRERNLLLRFSYRDLPKLYAVEWCRYWIS